MQLYLRHLLIFSLLILSQQTFSQIKETGIPSLVNHPRSSYNASTQNWAITQSSSGFIYVGNNDGILEYDGTSWTTYPVPNSSVVRSVMAVGDTIYAGAFEEIGFLAPNQQGQLSWNSLNHLIPAQYSGFDEIWNIFKLDSKIVFQSFHYIFIIENQELRVIKPRSSFSIMHLSKGSFYVVDKTHGFMRLEESDMQLLSNHPVFFRNEVRCVIQLEPERLLIGTSNEGLFIWDGEQLNPWNTEINNQLRENNLFSALELQDGHLAFGSINNGIFICDRNGRIIQHLNRYKGLQNNTVLSLFQDRRNNLWLGLDNGIDYLETSSPLTYLNYNYHIESAYTSIIHKGIMYVGTNQGLYAADLDRLRNSGNPQNRFRLIKGTEGQVWTLQLIDDALLCGHNFGCFQIDGYTARQISDIRGFWSFIKPDPHSPQILAGTYTGLVRLVKQQGQWRYAGEIDGFRESSRSMVLDANRNLWIAHGYRGLFRLHFDQGFQNIHNISFYHDTLGLPAALPYNIQRIRGQMAITTYEGILRYDYPTGQFMPDKSLIQLFEGKGFIDKLHQDEQGNIWYFTSNYLGVMRLLEDATYRDITSPFSGINDILLPAFQNIYVADMNNIYIGSQNGLVNYNPSIIKDYSQAEEVYIKEASFYGRGEIQSFFQSSQAVNRSAPGLTSIPFAMNSVTFRFTLPAFENPAKIRFSYRLKGFDENWSSWDAVNFKEYTNLKEGHYIFEVKAVNIFGTESPVRSFHFTIEPPFFRSPLAFGLYIFVFLLTLTTNFIYIRKRMLRIRQKEKSRHERRLAQRVQAFKEKSALSEQEIMHLRNESLRNEMKFKNKELANATLHLIQKNKTLTNLRNDLSKLLRSTAAETDEKHLVNNLVKKINKDLRNEKNWELFNNYFDEVHQDFINRVKEKHTDLTPKELRLCAYLRMNISTKEIAPLMNISVRGVEISRYRLRKKLNLSHDVNLTDYILNF